MDRKATITEDQLPKLIELIQSLPAILAGRVSDRYGIASGFRARIGHAIFSLIGPNFENLGAGLTGADGDQWPPLTKEYLAYRRRFGPTEKSELRQAAGLSPGAHNGIGGKRGLLTGDQLKLWKKTFAHFYAKFVMSTSDKQAKSHAAAIAWQVVKEAGGKTMLEVFGNRKVQMLVDSGRMAGSLQPGDLHERGPDADYQKPGGKGGPDQLFDDTARYLIILGTNVEYANYHHNAKSIKRRRRLWPRTFPQNWWRQILGATLSGLQEIVDNYKKDNYT